MKPWQAARLERNNTMDKNELTQEQITEAFLSIRMDPPQEQIAYIYAYLAQTKLKMQSIPTSGIVEMKRELEGVLDDLDDDVWLDRALALEVHEIFDNELSARLQGKR